MAYPEGVDLSKYDDNDYAWPEFVIVRLGSVREDDWRRVQHVTYARDHGITSLGSYFFIYPDTLTPEQQAEHAYSLQVSLNLHEAPHFADCEGGCTLDYGTRYIARMRELRGTCGLYSGGWIKQRGGGTLGADYGWLPHYSTTYVRPSGWSVEFTKLWQWTSSGGTLDRDRFLGTTNEMYDFFGGDMAAVDELLDGMTAAEAASVSATVDPGPPPETQTVYFKRGWNRVRFTINRMKLPHDTKFAQVDTVLLSQGDEMDGLTGQANAIESRVEVLESEPPGHTHTGVTVAGPAI